MCIEQAHVGIYMQIHFIVAYKYIHSSDEGSGVIFQLYSSAKVPIHCSRDCDVLNLISELSLPLIKAEFTVVTLGYKMNSFLSIALEKDT